MLLSNAGYNSFKSYAKFKAVCKHLYRVKARVGVLSSYSVNIRDIGQVQVRHADGRRTAGLWIEENCRVDGRNYCGCAFDVSFFNSMFAAVGT